MKSGVYKLTNIINGKIYIGLAKDFEKRKSGHRNCKKDTRISRAIRKYGWDNFLFEILELVEDLSLLEEKEEAYIKELNSTNREIGYNILEKNLCKYSENLPVEVREKQKLSAIKKYRDNPTLGKELTRGIREKFLPKISKKVKQIDKTNKETIRVWDSMQQASNELNIDRASISRCANKTIIKDRLNRDYVLPSAGGFIWEKV